MRAINRIEWNREAEGVWHATVYNVNIHRQQRFRAVNVSRRNWILYIDMEVATWEKDWVAVIQVKTWKECRKYLEDWFAKWLSDSSQTKTQPALSAR